MMSNNPSNMALSEITKSDGEPIDRLVYAGEHHLRKARRARYTRQQMIETGNDALMTFSQFRQQGVRNKIRKQYGLEPTYLPGEGKPNTIH